MHYWHMVNSNFRRNTWVPITNVTKSCAGVIHTNNASETGMCPSKMMLPGDVGGGIVFLTRSISPKAKGNALGDICSPLGKNVSNTNDFLSRWPMRAFVACNPEFKNSQQISIGAGWGRGTGVLYERLSATRQS